MVSQPDPHREFQDSQGYVERLETKILDPAERFL